MTKTTETLTVPKSKIKLARERSRRAAKDVTYDVGYYEAPGAVFTRYSPDLGAIAAELGCAVDDLLTEVPPVHATHDANLPEPEVGLLRTPAGTVFRQDGSNLGSHTVTGAGPVADYDATARKLSGEAD
jgi:hypothetical protein